MSRRFSIRAAALAALILAPSVAFGYGILLHSLIPTRSLANERWLANTPVRTTTLTGVQDADLARFRVWLYGQARTLPDTAVRNAFIRRYPTAQAFDARAFREFLMLNGNARVLGIDSFAAVYRTLVPSEARLDPYPQYSPGASIPLLTALGMGSIYPALDRRNQDRLFRGPDGAVQLTAQGDTVPFDPMTLNMGRLTGATSQAHAHIGLNHVPKSTNPGVMRSAPWNYVVAPGFPGAVETYAEQNAQLYTDLSLLALFEGGPGTNALSSIFAGSAMHYLTDVADGTHTVQGWSSGVQNDVTLARLLGQLKTGFGLWGKAPTREALAVDIIANLQSLSEKIFQAELSQAMPLMAQGDSAAVLASMRPAPEALGRGDTTMHVNYHALINNATRDTRYPDFGRLLAAAVIDEGNQEGADILRYTRALASGAVRRAAVVVDFDTVPNERVWDFTGSRTSSSAQAALQRYNAAQIKALKRANEVVQAWWYAYGLVTQPSVMRRPEARPTILGRLVSQQLTYLAAAEARRATWIQSHGGAGR